MEHAQFSLRFAVAAADIDDLGHVNQHRLSALCAEIATAHWRARASADAQRLCALVMRHEIDYRAPLELGDEIRRARR